MEPASQKESFNLLIGATGSVATIKLIELTRKIKFLFQRPQENEASSYPLKRSIHIKIVMTNNSKHFVHKDQLVRELDDPSIVILDDSDEWAGWKDLGDPVLHIELRRWADLFLIAPLDANTMAKLSNGICDNLLTCVVRAWDTSRPLVYCPAMNVYMYDHPITRDQLCKLDSFGYIRIDCIEKKLACGDTGMGAMASTDTIADKIFHRLVRQSDS